jgi:simple sugar transport system permease protein
VIEFLVSVLRSGTPLVYVAMAGMLAQRSGIWHLGLEGLMIIGACGSVLGTIATGSLAGGMAIAALACVLGSVLLWFLIEKLRANPIIAGLGVTGLGLGGTDLAVQAVYDSEGAVHSDIGLPRLGPEFGPYATLTVLALIMPFIVVALWVLLRRTRFGLQLAASGEHPFAARSVGVDPSRMRLIALAMGGVLCALAGTDLAMGSLQIFSVNMTAGRGFMGFAAVIFGAGHPFGVAGAALFFAIVESLGIKAQLVFGDAIPRAFVLMLPYFATILGVWVSGRLRGGTRSLLGTTELRDY